MAFTAINMQATMPQLTAIPSIGSAAENWAREDDSAQESLHLKSEGKLLTHMFGEAEFEASLERFRAMHEEVELASLDWKRLFKRVIDKLHRR